MITALQKSPTGLRPDSDRTPTKNRSKFLNTSFLPLFAPFERSGRGWRSAATPAERQQALALAPSDPEAVQAYINKYGA